MRYSTAESDKTRTQDQRAALLVDYENLFLELNHRLSQRDRPEELISEILDELRRYLQEEVRTQTASITAYADFGDMHGSGQYIQRALYLRGAEPRFVPAMLQRNAAEIQLCVDAMDLLHTRPDIHTYVLLTGDRPYLPLVQQIKRFGCHPIIAMLAPPPSTESLPNLEEGVFLNALNLLSDASRQLLSSSSGGSDRGASSSRSTTTTPAPAPQRGRTHPVTHLDVTDDGAYRALEIIEEYFGQYEEVYLTPLLRKMSELLDESIYDPKTLISELEEAGAVWLEKRRGFPYDYTVLLIDTEHPDVQAIQQELYDQDSPQPEKHAYIPEGEADEYYSDDTYSDDGDDYEEEEPVLNGTAAFQDDESSPDNELDFVDAEEEEDL